MGTLTTMRERFPQTRVWIDSIVESEIDFALENGSRGITTAPSITAYAVKNERALWLDRARRIHAAHPAYSERKLLWACMYEAAEEAAAKLRDLFDPNAFGMDGHLAIQANIYDFNNAEKMIRQAEKIHSLGDNFIIKIPTTQAGLVAIEEIVAGGHSVLATSCASVAQVVQAAQALTRGHQRLLARGGSEGGLCLSIAMQHAWQDMCVQNYAKQHAITLSENASRYAAIAVAKKSYHILRERFPNIAFMLSNLKTDLHIREFLGGDLLLTLPMAAQRNLDAWERLEDRIGAPVAQDIVEELLEKIPHYRQSYCEDGMTADAFATCIPFCRIVNDFLTPYEETIRVMRDVIVPNRYGNDAPQSY